ncbi:MAG: hypothetical protein GTO22_14435 [Gemmatimonadales bacterium]|nr:hypothetical protein [Gemmatimonadales bacterium]
MARSDGTVASFEDAHAVEETDKGLKVFFLGKARWLPKSGIDAASEVQEKEDRGRLIVKGWLARNEGWELD